MDVFGSAALPREHRETRRVTGDDAWRAAALGGAFDHAGVNREAARRMGLRERLVGPAWVALALESLARRRLGEDARVVGLDLRFARPLHVGEEVALRLSPLADAGDDVRYRAEAAVAGAVAAEGTMRVRFGGSVLA